MENLTTTTQKISSPGLERFDELINKLRKSALTTRDNPFPSIHAPKPTKKSQPTKQEREVEVQAQTETTVNSPNKDGKTSKSPLSTTSPIAHSFIVNLSSSALSGPAEPSDPTDPPAAELNKLDWASLVEAARQSDAEEDELPDLTEWATKAVKDSLQDSPEHLPLKRDKTFKAAQIQVQSRPEIENPSSSSHSLAKIQLAGSLKPSPSSSTAPVKASRDNHADVLPPRRSDDSSKALTGTTPFSPPTPNRSHPNPCSSRLLNEKQKQSIARLIIPVQSESPSLPLVASSSASTTTASTAARSSIPPSSCTAVKPPLSQDSPTLSTTIPLPHLDSAPSSSSTCGPSAPVDSAAGPRLSSGCKTRGTRHGGRPLDPTGLRVVLGCLKAASERREYRQPAVSNAVGHGADSVGDAPPVGGEETASASAKMAASAKKSKKKKRAMPTPTTGLDKTKKKSSRVPPPSTTPVSPPSSSAAATVGAVPRDPPAPPPVSAPARASTRRSRPSTVLFDKLTGGALLLK